MIMMARSKKVIILGDHPVTESIIRHYDVSGKLCPKYFVEHEEEWVKFKEDVASYMKENKAMLSSSDYLTFSEQT